MEINLIFIENERGVDYALPVIELFAGFEGAFGNTLGADMSPRPPRIRTAIIEGEVGNMPKLRGKVVSGIGNFSLWIERLRDHYQRKTGMVFFPGTLNVQLERPWLVPAGSLRLEGAEYGGTVTVNIVPCSVLDRPAFILRTTANDEGRGHHPQTIIEIATDVKLRDAYQLRDGDWVEVEIADEARAL